MRILRSVEPLGHLKRETYLDSLSLLAPRTDRVIQLIPYFLQREQVPRELIRLLGVEEARCVQLWLSKGVSTASSQQTNSPSRPIMLTRASQCSVSSSMRKP
jgi:hypothetical protein